MVWKYHLSVAPMCEWFMIPKQPACVEEELCGCHTAYGSHNGHRCLWLNFKVVEQREPTVLSQKS